MDKKYLLQDIADLLCTAENIKKKDAEDYLKAYFEVLEAGLLKDKLVKINYLGSFKLIEAEARTSVDVNTGRSFLIKEHYKLSFLPDATIKDIVNKPFAAFEPVETNEEIPTKEAIISVQEFIVESTDIHKDSEISEDQFSDTSIYQSSEVIIEPEAIPHTIEKDAIQHTIEKDAIHHTIEQETIQQTNYNDEPLSEAVGNPVKSEYNIQNKEKINSLSNIFQEISETGIIAEDLDDSPELVSKEAEGDKKKADKKWKYAFFIFLSVVAAIAVFWTVKSNIDARRELEDKILVLTKFLEEKNNQPVFIDSLKKNSEDSLIVKSDTVVLENPIKDEPEYPIYVIIHPAENLMTLAKKYYRHKSFWVYIYQDNRDIIKNPDDITVGKSLRISKPDLKKMNPDDPECIKQAGVLQYQILSSSKSVSQNDSTQ